MLKLIRLIGSCARRVGHERQSDGLGMGRADHPWSAAVERGRSTLPQDRRMRCHRIPTHASPATCQVASASQHASLPADPHAARGRDCFAAVHHASSSPAAEGRLHSCPCPSNPYRHAMFAWLRSLFAPKTPAPDLSQAPDEPVPSERVASTRPANQQGWIGVDLDGTLAEATSWQGHEPYRAAGAADDAPRPAVARAKACA